MVHAGGPGSRLAPGESHIGKPWLLEKQDISASLSREGSMKGLTAEGESKASAMFCADSDCIELCCCTIPQLVRTLERNKGTSYFVVL